MPNRNQCSIQAPLVHNITFHIWEEKHFSVQHFQTKHHPALERIWTHSWILSSGALRNIPQTDLSHVTTNITSCLVHLRLDLTSVFVWPLYHIKLILMWKCAAIKLSLNPDFTKNCIFQSNSYFFVILRNQGKNN